MYCSAFDNDPISLLDRDNKAYWPGVCSVSRMCLLDVCTELYPGLYRSSAGASSDAWRTPRWAVGGQPACSWDYKRHVELNQNTMSCNLKVCTVCVFMKSIVAKDNKQPSSSAGSHLLSCYKPWFLKLWVGIQNRSQDYWWWVLTWEERQCVLMGLIPKVRDYTHVQGPRLKRINTCYE